VKIADNRLVVVVVAAVAASVVEPLAADMTPVMLVVILAVA
jgi:hypothetical protein